MHKLHYVLPSVLAFSNMCVLHFTSVYIRGLVMCLQCACDTYAICMYCLSKAVADGPIGEVLAGTLFLKVITKFHFTKSK